MANRHVKISALVTVAFVVIVGLMATVLSQDRGLRAPDRTTTPPPTVATSSVPDRSSFRSVLLTQDGKGIAESIRAQLDEMNRRQEEREMEASWRSVAATRARHDALRRQQRRGILVCVVIAIAIVGVIILVSSRQPNEEADTDGTLPETNPPTVRRSYVTAKCEHCGTVQDAPAYGRCTQCGGRLGDRRIVRLGPWVL